MAKQIETKSRFRIIELEDQIAPSGLAANLCVSVCTPCVSAGVNVGVGVCLPNPCIPNPCLPPPCLPAPCI
jgi:hypothetical protein